MSNWVNQEIQPPEKIIYTSGRHWIMLYQPISFFIMLIFSWWFLIPAVLWSLYKLYKFSSYQLILTNKRLIQKKGFYYIQTEEWALYEIGDVVCSQILSDNLWNRGKVILTGHQITVKKFTNIWNAKKLRDAVPASWQLINISKIS